jgi:Tol biopolymer transport system component
MAAVTALGVGAISIADAPDFSDWSDPVNLGAAINTNFVESAVSVSKNGLSLYFASNRAGGLGDWDLWVAQRASVEDDWGTPQWLGANINSSSRETHPALSLDEHRLYFVSGRPGGCGGNDIYVSRRRDRRNDFGWEPAQNLGCMPDYINSPLADETPGFFEDETGQVIMYFSSTRTGGLGSYDIYASVMSDDDTFGPGEIVAELSTASSENGAAVRRDGLEVIFASNRPGGLGGMDLWMATRDGTADPWSTPVNLSALNSSSMDGCRMSLSFDGRTLYFTSDRPVVGSFGLRDLYMSTRTKLRGKPGSAPEARFRRNL